MRERFSSGDEQFEVVAIPGSGGSATVRIDGSEYQVTELSISGDMLSFIHDGQSHSYSVNVEHERVQLKRDGKYFSFGRLEEGSEDQQGAGAGALSSRMPGTVLRTLVQAGESVSRGTALVILEAMKMEHTIVAPADGVVNSYPHAEGSRVMPGDLLVDFSAEGDA